MFTGIVRDKGIVTTVRRPSDGAMSLSILSSLPLTDFEIGASVACNGVCLTVCEAHQIEGHKVEFRVDIGHETLNASRFGSVSVGTEVHLEPALRVGDALGGHHVTGHVEGLARVVSLQRADDNFYQLVLEIPSQWSAYMINKGSIAVAGVSLTIAHVRPHAEKPKACLVEIMLIPHTIEKTCLGSLQADDSIEIECDHMVKTVASVVTRMLNMRE